MKVYQKNEINDVILSRKINYYEKSNFMWVRKMSIFIYLSFNSTGVDYRWFTRLWNLSFKTQLALSHESKMADDRQITHQLLVDCCCSMHDAMNWKFLFENSWFHYSL